MLLPIACGRQNTPDSKSNKDEATRAAVDIKQDDIKQDGGKQDSGDSAEPPIRKSDAEASFRRHVPDDSSRSDGLIEQLHIGGERTVAELDGDPWDSEDVTRKADTQLKNLARLCEANRPLTATSLAQIVDPQVEFVVPSMDQLEEVYDQSPLRVMRARSPGTSAEQTLRGSQSLADWLNSAMPRGNRNVSTRVQFKNFGIELRGDTIQTIAWMNSGIVEPNKRSNLSSTWKCDWSRSEGQLRLRSLHVDGFERAELRADAPLYTDCTKSVLGKNRSYSQQLLHGQDYWLNRLQLYDGIIAVSYHGLAIGDVNGDSLDDVYVCQPGGANGGLPNRLFVQQADGTASDKSAVSGTDWLLETTSALFIDLDNDGDQDLVAATIAGLIFAENDGSGTFQPQLRKTTAEAPVISIAASDFDNDGDLDIYAASYGRRAAADLMGRPVPYHDANNGARNALFRNDRDWRFTNVTKHVGLEKNNSRFSLACSWEDFDNDGDQDLYVANDFGRNNLYQNEGGTFVDIAAKANVEDMSAGMSVAWGDYDNDGRADLYVSNMWSSAGNRIAFQRQFLKGTQSLVGNTSESVLAGFRRHARGNSLFRNVTQRENSHARFPNFRDMSVESRTTIGGWAWSSAFIDINNDGWEDLVVANGNVTQDDPHDL